MAMDDCGAGAARWTVGGAEVNGALEKIVNGKAEAQGENLIITLPLWQILVVIFAIALANGVLYQKVTQLENGQATILTKIDTVDERSRSNAADLRVQDRRIDHLERYHPKGN